VVFSFLIYWDTILLLGGGGIAAIIHWWRKPIPPNDHDPPITLFLKGYRELKLLDQGGFGRVYKAKRNSDGMAVALKLQKMEGFTTMDSRIFDGSIREAETWSELTEKNTDSIVEIFEYGSEPLPWIAMELMEGGTLRERMKGGPLPLKQVLEIGNVILEALKTAQ